MAKKAPRAAPNPNAPKVKAREALNKLAELTKAMQPMVWTPATVTADTTFGPISNRSRALADYIETKAQVLDKVLALANGHPLTIFRPTENGMPEEVLWYPDPETQREALYALLPKVAPDLKAMEITVGTDAGQGEQQQLFDKIIGALTDVAHRRATSEVVDASATAISGPSKVAGEGKAKSTTKAR